MGIVLTQSGDDDGDKQGEIRFTHPDGTEFHMTYVANENGFQPQSSALPVAPAFPHPIPAFVLEQIEFARQEDEATARAGKSSVRTPSTRYGRPDSSEEDSRKKRDAPARGYAAPRIADSDEFIPILRDDRVQEEDGTYNFDVETGNGIIVSESGDSGEKQGVISFTHPDGTPFHLTFVADENGFQPQSDALPVAPAFPHPIPDFVLEQIEFARQQKEDESDEQFVRTPSSRYASPNRKRRETPSNAYSAPRFVDSAESVEHIPILRDDRYREDDGKHNFDFETANGIQISQ